MEAALGLLRALLNTVSVTSAELAPAGIVTWPGEPLKVYCLPKMALPVIA